jgi:hypothetical protein
VTGRQQGFFATRSDLESLLRLAEEGQSLIYVGAGLFADPERPCFSTGLAIPNLGSSQSGDSVQDPSFIVLTKGSPVAIRDVPQRAGGVRYAVDLLKNPGGMEFHPGGLHGDSLIAGRIATLSQDSFDVYGLFQSALSRLFGWVKGWRLGPEAASLFNTGRRLTTGVATSSDYDLRP